MDRESDAMGMLDLMVSPSFCVKENKIIKCNAAAERLLFAPGMEISPLLATGQEEYAEFTGGCLYLTLSVSNCSWGASVTRHGDWDVFVLEENADRAELQAMALAARELREPLSTIMATAELMFPMSALDNDPKLREQASHLNRGLYQMLRILGNMSDAGSFATPSASELETWEMMALFAEFFEKIRTLIEPAGITLRFENLSQPTFCLASRDKLERAVLNIVSNAMKFSPANGTIDAVLARFGDQLRLTVRDNGEGISNSIRGSVHSRFRRQSGLEDGRYGIGLGMVLIRSAAAIHGGTVLIDHPEGGGTRITMTMQIRQNTSGEFRSQIKKVDLYGGWDRTLVELSDRLSEQYYDPQKIN